MDVQTIMMLVWVGLVLFFVVVEAVTYQLTSIWFALGSIFGLITSVFTESIPLQILVFVLVSCICLLTLRPLSKKYLKIKSVPTNADSNIGKSGYVTIDINNEIGQGQVNVAGQIWTARSQDGQRIDLGGEIEVMSIEGVKLIVKEKKQQKSKPKSAVH